MFTTSTSALARMRNEFAAMAASGDVDSALARWAATDTALAGVTSPSALAAVLRGPDYGRRDAVLLALLRRAAGACGDAELAARLIVERMAPAVAATVARIVRLPSVADPAGDVEVMVLGHLWEQVRRYPLHRTHHVAANLVRDTHTATLRALGVHSRQRRDWRTGATLAHLVPLQEHDDPAIDTPRSPRNSSQELLELLAWALEQRWLDDRDARVLSIRYFGPIGRDGVATDAQIGQVCAVSKATAHRARVRAEAHLAAAADAYSGSDLRQTG